jgi:hypothetical protein
MANDRHDPSSSRGAAPDIDAFNPSGKLMTVPPDPGRMRDDPLIYAARKSTAESPSMI